MLASFFAVLRCAIFFASTVALVGGLTADIPGVKDDPAGSAALDFAAAAWLGILYIIRNHALGAGLCFAVIVFLHHMYTLPADSRLKREYANTREQALSPKPGKPSKVSKTRKKGGRRK